MADYQSNFAVPGNVEFKSHQDVFDYVELVRQISVYGAELLTNDHAYLLKKYANYVHKNWDKYEAANHPYAGQRMDSYRPLGSLMPSWRVDGAPLKVAREILRPIDAAAENLNAASKAIVTFRAKFYTGLEPIIHPVPARPHRTGSDEFDDDFPGRGRPTDAW